MVVYMVTLTNYFYPIKLVADSLRFQSFFIYLVAIWLFITIIKVLWSLFKL